MRVLLVDDDPLMRRLMRRALERDGMRVVGECSDAEATARFLAAEDVECVVCDLYLPSGPASAWLPGVRARYPAPRWVLVTAATEAPAAHAIGVEQVVAKDAGPAAVVQAVRGLLAPA